MWNCSKTCLSTRNSQAGDFASRVNADWLDRMELASHPFQVVKGNLAASLKQAVCQNARSTTRFFSVSCPAAQMQVRFSDVASSNCFNLLRLRLFPLMQRLSPCYSHCFTTHTAAADGWHERGPRLSINGRFKGWQIVLMEATLRKRRT